jgi:hypothetical protein
LRRARTAALVSLLAAAVPALAQMPPPPPSGPEHEMLRRDVGVWDATIEMFGPPGAPPMVSKGTETVTMLGPFWQVGDFKAEMFGQPFEGKGITGYDPAKKKYVGTWVDTISTSISTVEGTYDAAKRTMTGTMEGVGPDGAMTKTKQTTEWTDADTRVFTMYAPDGATPMMKISYKRRK